jgi:hypothetical protein
MRMHRRASHVVCGAVAQAPGVSIFCLRIDVFRPHSSRGVRRQSVSPAGSWEEISHPLRVLPRRVIAALDMPFLARSKDANDREHGLA